MLPLTSLLARLEADPRLSRVLHGGLSALGGRGLALVVNAVLLPLTLHYLGPLEFGVWITISTSVLMLSVLDLGIANTLTNLIAEANAANDHKQAAHFYASAFWVTTGVTLIVSVPLYAAWRVLDWASIFHVTGVVEVRHAALCVLIAAAFALFSLPLTLANKLLAGYQQVHVANYFAMASSLFSLVAITGTIWFRGTIVQLMASYCAALLLGTLCLNLWIWMWQRPWLRPRFRLIRARATRRIFGQGFLFFVIQCTGLVVFSSDNLVVTHYLGSAEVTPYSFAWRLTSYAALAQTVILPSLWPALSDAYHRRQIDWVRATYRAVSRNSMILVGTAGLIIALTGRQVIGLWAGSGATPGRGLLGLMAIFNFIMAITTTQAFLLNATGRVRLEAAVAVLAALANIGLSIYLVQKIGVNGVITASIISFLLFMVIPQQREVTRVLSGMYLACALRADDSNAAAIQISLIRDVPASHDFTARAHVNPQHVAEPAKTWTE